MGSPRGFRPLTDLPAPTVFTNGPTPTIGELRTAITRVYPELAASTFALLRGGWDSLAVDVDGRWVFKFPRNEAARVRLEREAAVLAIIHPAVDMPTPVLTLHDGPPVFSRHEMLPGDSLDPKTYATLDERARQRLAEDLAGFYAQLHALPAAPFHAAGAGSIGAWPEPEEILRRTWPLLEEPLRAWAQEAIRVWRDLPPDPHGVTFGYFDGHGWNMAFDMAARRLNGVFDFGDSGFGSLQQDFVYSGMVSPDLTRRVTNRYGAMTGRLIDLDRIRTVFVVLRLWELAESGEDPVWGPFALEALRQAAQDPR